MLNLQLSGQPYNKSEHRRALQQKLSQRSEGAIELKHQNISAVLIELRQPWIHGYKPMANYQSLLQEIVEARLQRDNLYDQIATAAVERPAAVPRHAGFDQLLVDAPSVGRIRQKGSGGRTPFSRGVKKDYLSLECRNRSLGRAGEQFVVEYEKYRLRQIGAEKLAESVEHVSETKGDGLGFDVRSFESSGKDRLIEVKTTSFGREAPFFVSRNELARSKSDEDKFYLYRLFEFREQPRMFSLKGAINAHCVLDPMSYLATFG